MTDINTTFQKTSKKTRYESTEELQQVRERKGKRNRTTRGNRMEWQPVSTVGV